MGTTRKTALNEPMSFLRGFCILLIFAGIVGLKFTHINIENVEASIAITFHKVYPVGRNAGLLLLSARINHPLVSCKAFGSKSLLSCFAGPRQLDSSYELRVSETDREALGFDGAPSIGENAPVLAYWPQ